MWAVAMAAEAEVMEVTGYTVVEAGAEEVADPVGRVAPLAGAVGEI